MRQARATAAVGFAISAVLAAAMAQPTPASGVAGFGDVAAQRFFSEPVQWMVDNDITTGTSPTCFSPDDFVTRGQTAAFMWRMEGEPAPAAAHPFGDVVAPWQQDPVAWMVENDITMGTSPATYSPGDSLTRGQLAALLHRLAGRPQGSPDHPFDDVFTDWQQQPVSWLADRGITTGTSPTTYSPDDLVTRGQLAAFFHRYKGSPAAAVDTSGPPCYRVGPSAATCLARANREVVGGVHPDRVSISSPSDDLTVDARDGVSLTTGVRALEVGRDRVSDGLCVVGWTVFGQQSRLLTWRQMHDDIGGSALRVEGSNYVVDGLRAVNVEDAFDPRGGEGFEVRNMWVEYIRDDCIENDERRAGVVIDSLFDGCYTFFSEQDAGDVAGESLIFDRVLVRMQSMPGPFGTPDPTASGHDSIFKKFDNGGRHHPVIHDSVFLMDEDCRSSCNDWPPGTVASDVMLVWTGAGEFPMSVLDGMTLTTDRSVWDDAVADWKQRHGCTTIDQPCTRLHDPAD